MEPAGDDPLDLRFPCGSWHDAAAKRLFAEACKIDPAGGVEPRPLTGTDSRSGQEILVEPIGAGRYRVTADGATDGPSSRAPAIARAMAKLAALDVSEDEETVVAFSCGCPHDAVDRAAAGPRPEPPSRAARGGDAGQPRRAVRSERPGDQ